MNNAAKAVLASMNHFAKTVEPLLSALSECLSKRFFRDRLVATCVDTNPTWRNSAWLLQSFPCDLVKHRWGSVTKVVAELRERRFIRLVWDDRKLMFAGEGGGAQQHKEGKSVSISMASEAVRSNLFWLWLDMFSTLASVMAEMERWWEACPCHEAEDVNLDHPDHSAKRTRKDAFRKRLCLDYSCPLSGCRSPELAAGDFDGFVASVTALGIANVMMHCEGSTCSEEERSVVVEDFESARNAFLFH
eukprot:746934-Alexandrium_andersonii.AAC.1